MPHLNDARKAALDGDIDRTRANLMGPGDLTYAVTHEVIRYVESRPLRFAAIAEALGSLEAAKLELYRQVAEPYEDGKAADNGNVYPEPLRRGPGYVPGP